MTYTLTLKILRVQSALLWIAEGVPRGEPAVEGSMSSSSKSASARGRDRWFSRATASISASMPPRASLTCSHTRTQSAPRPHAIQMIPNTTHALQSGLACGIGLGKIRQPTENVILGSRALALSCSNYCLNMHPGMPLEHLSRQDSFSQTDQGSHHALRACSSKLGACSCSIFHSAC